MKNPPEPHRDCKFHYHCEYSWYVLGGIEHCPALDNEGNSGLQDHASFLCVPR